MSKLVTFFGNLTIKVVCDGGEKRHNSNMSVDHEKTRKVLEGIIGGKRWSSPFGCLFRGHLPASIFEHKKIVVNIYRIITEKRFVEFFEKHYSPFTHGQIEPMIVFSETDPGQGHIELGKLIIPFVPAEE